MTLFIIPCVVLVLAYAGIGFLARRESVGVRVMKALGLSLVIAYGTFLLLVFAPELHDSRIRTYKRFHSELRLGMTHAEILAAVEKHYPKNGRRQSPKMSIEGKDYVGFFMNPENSGEPNCEGIFVYLRDGRAERILYSPD